MITALNLLSPWVWVCDCAWCKAFLAFSSSSQDLSFSLPRWMVLLNSARLMRPSPFWSHERKIRSACSVGTSFIICKRGREMHQLLLKVAWTLGPRLEGDRMQDSRNLGPIWRLSCICIGLWLKGMKASVWGMRTGGIGPVRQYKGLQIQWHPRDQTVTLSATYLLHDWDLKNCQCTTGLHYKAVSRFGDFCSCCCLPLLPWLACSILTTWERPYSGALYVIDILTDIT